jgi:hypothetical protein
MKMKKSSWKVYLAVASSFALGIVLSHSLAMKASPTGIVNVTPISMSGMNPGSGVARGEVVGFSCVPDESHPGDGICYIATR